MPYKIIFFLKIIKFNKKYKYFNYFTILESNYFVYKYHQFFLQIIYYVCDGTGRDFRYFYKNNHAGELIKPY